MPTLILKNDAALGNFFKEDCLIAEPEQVDQVDPAAAVFYPIILPDRLAVIVSLPGQTLTYYATSPEAKVTKERIINDTSTAEFMEEFYHELAEPRLTKAEALRRAQLSLLKSSQTSNYQHPYYWAPYVLIGNWQ